MQMPVVHIHQVFNQTGIVGGTVDDRDSSDVKEVFPTWYSQWSLHLGLVLALVSQMCRRVPAMIAANLTCGQFLLAARQETGKQYSTTCIKSASRGRHILDDVRRRDYDRV